MEKRRVTLHQRDILKLLSQHKQVTIGELASFLGVSSVAATKHANRLEQKKLVRRIRFFGEASFSPQAMRIAMA
jgi:DNA-binding MarR family transcriptional regulator